MRLLMLLSLVVGSSLFAAACTAAEDARAVLEGAIQAHGGAARLERTTRGRLQGKVEGRMNNADCKAEWKETFDLPGRYRRTIDGSFNAEPYHMEYAVTGTRGWIREGKKLPREFAVPEPLPVAQHWHAILADLLMLRDKRFQLTTLPDETKDGRTFAGIRAVSTQGRADFYFDKATRLLAHVNSPLMNVAILQPKQETMAERSFDDYHDIKGVLYPMKFRTTSGKANSLTITLSSVEFLDKIDASVFDKPEVAVARKPSEALQSREETPIHRERWLIVTIAGAGVFIGVVWLFARASRQGKQETPRSGKRRV